MARAGVFLNGQLMREGEDCKVTWARGAVQVEWAGVLPAKGDEISVQYLDPEPSAVDQLGEVALTPEERKRRQRMRSMNTLFRQPVEIGISSRGTKPK